ncbi:MAG: cyclic nucleotide-binding domain-containing protein, partial [Vicinamibacterales bacterium]
MTRPWSSVSALEALVSADLDLLSAASTRLSLHRGDVLTREGEASTDLYFLLSGRLAVFKGGSQTPVAEIAQGQPVGEVGFFGRMPRTATVVALRDSTVLQLSKERFDEISHTSPQIHRHIVASLARRLARTTDRSVAEAMPVRTLAVLPAGEGDAHLHLAAELRREWSSTRDATFLDATGIQQRFGAAGIDDESCTRWLNAAEAEIPLVVYVADGTLTPWTEKCVRQADALLLVGDSRLSPSRNRIEEYASRHHGSSHARLVLLHPSRSAAVSGTARWLKTRSVQMHHHATWGDIDDVKRLARFICGKATGFVAGGGGALGSAHLGVYRAFVESGWSFDVLGGSSVGAAMVAGLAIAADPDRVDEGTHNIFVRSRAFRRPTLPWFSLLDHTVFDRALLAEYGDVHIEDLWLPFFAVASDVSSGRQAVIRSGPVWLAVRASSASPGVLPPFFTGSGSRRG